MRRARCGRGWWPSAPALEIIEQKLLQHILLVALLLTLRSLRIGGRIRASRGLASGSGSGLGGLRGGCGAAQRVRVGEEPLLHLIGALAKDDGFHVVLGAHLLHGIGGLHLREQAGVVLARFHLDETDGAGQREALLLAQDGEHVPVHLDASLLRPFVKHELGYEEVVGLAALRILAARRSSYLNAGSSRTDTSDGGSRAM